MIRPGGELENSSGDRRRPGREQRDRFHFGPKTADPKGELVTHFHDTGDPANLRLPAVKRQAARFRIFAYAPCGDCLGEVTIASVRSIEWTVELANRKASDRGPSRRPAGRRRSATRTSRTRMQSRLDNAPAAAASRDPATAPCSTTGCSWMSRSASADPHRHGRQADRARGHGRSGHLRCDQAHPQMPPTTTAGATMSPTVR